MTVRHTCVACRRERGILVWRGEWLGKRCAGITVMWTAWLNEYADGIQASETAVGASRPYFRHRYTT